MMRISWLMVVMVLAGQILAQSKPLTEGSMLHLLKPNDSLIYYQCRVIKANVQIQTGNTTANASEQQITLTEKFVIKALDKGYTLKHYTSGMTIFPNRKFSGLKIREKNYWNFSYQNEKTLNDEEVSFLSQLEVTGKETTEYDFAITKYTTNQIIVKKGKDFEQKLPIKDVSISDVLKL